jgi:Icc-related predicted phosphoesterase
VTLLIGALADIHGNFDAMTRAMERHPEVPFWLCVGDLASLSGAYPEPPRPLYWIKGNNEDFERIAAWQSGEPQPRNLHYIPSGAAVTAGPLRVAGLGGTFAPTWFGTAAAELPHAASRRTGSRGAAARDDKRRHFVREEVEACKGLGAVDVLMTHEAARPFVVVTDPRPGGRPRRLDAGKPAINDVLASLQPRLHLCGHHHRFIESVREGVRSVCIDRVSRSYLLIDAATLEYRKVDQ